MPSAMQVVQTFAPHILSSQDINLGTAGSAWELTEFYLDMPLEHKGVDMLLQIGKRSKGDGTGNICRAIEILGTTVEQQHTLRLQGDICLWSGFVVNDGGMATVAGDGIEGDIAVERLFGSQRGQFLINRDFRQF